MTGIVFITVAIIAICAISALLIRGLFAGASDPVADEAWLRHFTPARYKPMARLLADDDYEFMIASGADPAVIRRLRSERRRIFRAYLDNLVRDFNRVHRAARILAMESAEDQPEMVSRLIRVKWEFTLAVVAVRVRLALHAAGIGAVDVRGVLDAIESVRFDMGKLQPARQPIAL